MRLWLRYAALPSLRRARESVEMWIAWKLPKGVVYWCAIRVGVHEPRDLTLDEFARWERVPERRFADGLTFWPRAER